MSDFHLHNRFCSTWTIISTFFFLSLIFHCLSRLGLVPTPLKSSRALLLTSVGAESGPYSFVLFPPRLLFPLHHLPFTLFVFLFHLSAPFLPFIIFSGTLFQNILSPFKTPTFAASSPLISLPPREHRWCFQPCHPLRTMPKKGSFRKPSCHRL